MLKSFLFQLRSRSAHEAWLGSLVVATPTALRSLLSDGILVLGFAAILFSFLAYTMHTVKVLYIYCHPIINKGVLQYTVLMYL